MSNSARVIVSKDLTEFFRNEISTARCDLGIQLNELVEYYVVRLLCDFSRPETTQLPGDEPLALMYKRALESSLPEQAQLLKNLGDAALYIAGFFTEFIERSLVDLDYYISMGGNAYNRLSELVGGQRHGETFGDLYMQMGRRFTELVDLLNEVAERAQTTGDRHSDLLRLYDRWARTKSQRIHKLLIEKGLIPSPNGLPTDYTQ